MFSFEQVQTQNGVHRPTVDTSRTKLRPNSDDDDDLLDLPPLVYKPHSHSGTPNRSPNKSPTQMNNEPESQPSFHVSTADDSSSLLHHVRGSANASTGVSGVKLEDAAAPVPAVSDLPPVVAADSASTNGTSPSAPFLHTPQSSDSEPKAAPGHSANGREDPLPSFTVVVTTHLPNDRNPPNPLSLADEVEADALDFPSSSLGK